MPFVRFLSALYFGVYVLSGVVLMAIHPPLVAALWLPFGVAMAGFGFALGRAGAVARIVATTIPTAGAMLALALAGFALPAVLGERRMLPPSLVPVLIGVAALVVPIAMAALIARLGSGLGGPDRRRGLVAVVAAPSVGLSVAVVVSIAAEVSTPRALDLPDLAHMWCGLFALWLAGAWLTALVVRDRIPARPVLPIARARPQRPGDRQRPVEL